MSNEVNMTRVCPSCKNICAPDAAFCASCGTKLSATNFCARCGARRTENAVFCHACGAKFEGGTAPNIPTVPVVKRSTVPQRACETSRSVQKSVSRAPIEWVRAFVLLLVALALTVFAFCPVAKIAYFNSYSEMDADIRISPIESVVYFFDSLKDEDEDDLEDSDLYEENDDILEDILEYVDDDDEVPEALVEDFVKTALRLGLQHEDTATSASLVLAAVLSLVYLLICLAFLVLAILNLVFFLIGKKTLLFRVAVLLLTLIPALIPALVFAMTASLSSLSVLGYRFGLAFGGVVGLILSMLAVVFVIVSSYIFNKRRVRLAALLLRVFCVLLIAAAMVSAFLPAIKLEIDVIPSGKDEERAVEMEYPLGMFAGFALGEDELEQYEDYKDFETADYIQVCRDAFSVYKISQIDNGEADALGQEVLVALAFGCGEDHVASWFAQYVTLAILVLLVLAFLLWFALYALCFDRAYVWATVPCRVLAPLFACVLLALCGLFVFLINENILQLDLKRDMICNISIAPILLAAFSLVACCLPFLAGKKSANTPWDEACVATSTAIIEEAPNAQKANDERPNEDTVPTEPSGPDVGQEETASDSNSEEA